MKKNNGAGVFLNKDNDTDVIKIRGAVMLHNYKYLNDEEYDYVCPQHVENALKQAGNKVRVEINSGGGDVYAGVEIYNMLKTSDKDITTVITGRASSIASIIAQAGEKRLMFNNSQILSHRAWTFHYGNCNDFLDMAEELERVDANLRTIYMKHYKGTEQELINLMNEDRHMNAQEALEQGFIDEVIESYSDTGENSVASIVEREIDTSKLNGLSIEDVVNEVLRVINETQKDKTDTEKKDKNLFNKFKEEK